MADWRLPFSRPENTFRRSRSRSPWRDMQGPSSLGRYYDDRDEWRMPDKWPAQYETDYSNNGSRYYRREYEYESWEPPRDHGVDSYGDYGGYIDRYGDYGDFEEARRRVPYRHYDRAYDQVYDQRRGMSYQDFGRWEEDEYYGSRFKRPGYSSHMSRRPHHFGGDAELEPRPVRVVHDESEFPEKMDKPPKPQFHCNICDISATNKDQLEDHFRGIKHLKKLGKKKTKPTTVPQQSHTEDDPPAASSSITDGVTVKVCSICGKHLEDENLDTEKHEETERHQKWLEIFKKHQQNKKKATKISEIFRDVVMPKDEMEKVLKLEENPNGYFCDTCDITLQTYAIYKQHVHGQKHQKLLLKKTSGENNDAKYHCDVCDIDVQGERSLKSHLEGQKHRKKVTRMENPDSGADANTTATVSTSTSPTDNRFHCSVCDIRCTSQVDFDNHMKGKQHKKKMKKNLKKEQTD